MQRRPEAALDDHRGDVVARRDLTAVPIEGVRAGGQPAAEDTCDDRLPLLDLHGHVVNSYLSQHDAGAFEHVLLLCGVVSEKRCAVVSTVYIIALIANPPICRPWAKPTSLSIG